VPEAGSSLIAFLASLGVREAIAFGEGVPLPTRFRFKDLPRERLPRSTSGDQARLDVPRQLDHDFIAAVVDRWREATTTTSRPNTKMMGLDSEAMMVGSMGGIDSLGKPLLGRKVV
jgi:hypothetical protein